MQLLQLVQSFPTLFEKAVEENNIEIIENNLPAIPVLINHGLNINKKHYLEDTIASYRLLYGLDGIFLYLLQQKCVDLSHINRDFGDSLLHLSFSIRNSVVVGAIVNHASPNLLQKKINKEKKLLFNVSIA